MNGWGRLSDIGVKTYERKGSSIYLKISRTASPLKHYEDESLDEFTVS